MTKPSYKELEQRINELEKVSLKQKQSMRTLNKSTEQWQAMLEVIKEGSFETNIKGDFIHVNNFICEMLEYSSEELIGMNYKEYMGKKTTGKVYQALGKMIKAQKSATVFQWEIFSRSGIKKYAEVSIAVKKDFKDRVSGFRGIVKDISKRIEKQEMLFDELSEYIEFADSLPQIIFEIDETGIVTFINRNGVNLLGYTKDEIIKGIEFLQLIIPEDRNRILQNFENLYLEQNLTDVECSLIRKDGTFFPVVLYVNPIIAKKKPVGLRGVMVDISRLKLAEKESEKTRKELDLMAKKERNIRNIFQKYVPSEIVKKVVDKATTNLIAIGEKKEVSLLNVDIRGYSILSRTVKPESVIAILNYFFEIMGSAVLKHKGLVDKFLGDGLLAVFGAPVATANPALDAVYAALEMIDTIKKVSLFSEKECSVSLAIGISINTGEAIVGNIGFDKKMEYTSIGDVVNNTFRLQEMTKEKPDSVMICDVTYEKTKNHITARSLGTAPFGTKVTPMQLFEVTGKK